MNDHEHDDRTPFDERDGNDRDLERALGRLPRAVEPERDLWPAIAARLGKPAAAGTAGGPDARPAAPPVATARRFRGWHLALAAALLATLAGTGFGLWRLALPGAGPERQAAAPGAETPAGVVEAPGATTAVPAADAFGDRLLAALERKRYQLGPEAAAAVEADIVRLGMAVAELVAALSDHPDQPALYHQLAARQRQEAELLMRLDRL